MLKYVGKSWSLLLLSVLAALLGCSRPRSAREGGEAKWLLLQCKPSVGDGLTNVLSSTLGATLSGSSPFHASPNDGAILLQPPTRQSYAAAAGTTMPQWLTYSLGAPVPVQAAAISWYSPADYGRDFRIEGRRDSRELWHPLAVVRDNSEMLWQTTFPPCEIAQVRLTVENAAGQGRTLVKRFYLFSPKPRITANVALTEAGLRIEASSPHDPSTMFAGRVGSSGSTEYAAALSTALPHWLTFSLPKEKSISAVGVSWYDNENYATHFKLEARSKTDWEPVVEVADAKDVGGFYVFPTPVVARTFRLTVYATQGQPRLLARQLALYGRP
jgi:hypothetical protein